MATIINLTMLRFAVRAALRLRPRTIDPGLIWMLTDVAPLAIYFQFKSLHRFQTCRDWELPKLRYVGELPGVDTDSIPCFNAAGPIRKISLEEATG